MTIPFASRVHNADVVKYMPFDRDVYACHECDTLWVDEPVCFCCGAKVPMLAKAAPDSVSRAWWAHPRDGWGGDQS